MFFFFLVPVKKTLKNNLHNIVLNKMGILKQDCHSQIPFMNTINIYNCEIWKTTSVHEMASKEVKSGLETLVVVMKMFFCGNANYGHGGTFNNRGSLGGNHGGGGWGDSEGGYNEFGSNGRNFGGGKLWPLWWWRPIPYQTNEVIVVTEVTIAMTVSFNCQKTKFSSIEEPE
ncbi:hypothetical protein J0S82_007121, partial [Galemys pyrenaicus]